MNTIQKPYINKGLSRPIFIAFEGLDGSGKSTCAKRTAELLGADTVYMTTPSPQVRKYRDDLIASYGDSQEAKQFFYLSTVFAASEEVRALLRNGRSVVLDRYFLSTQAYAEFRGSQLKIDAVQSLLLPADLTVFLNVPLALRRNRVAIRGASNADQETLDDNADARLRAAHYARTNLTVVGRFAQIDSSGLSIDETAQHVIAEIALLLS